MTTTAHLEELARNSRRSAIYSGVGIAVLVASLVISTVTLSHLQKRRNALEANIANLNALKAQTQSELRQAVQKLNEQSLLINGPLAQVARPQASATLVNGVKTAGGWPVYDFLISVAVPDVRKKEIKEVDYFFNDPTIHNKIRHSSEAATDYTVSYRGYGCFPLLPIHIVLRSGSTVPLYFNQCKALGYSPETPASILK